MTEMDCRKNDEGHTLLLESAIEKETMLMAIMRRPTRSHLLKNFLYHDVTS